MAILTGPMALTAANTTRTELFEVFLCHNETGKPLSRKIAKTKWFHMIVFDMTKTTTLVN
jgi:hypothetical protein